MSYSFSVKAATVDEAKTKVREELAKVIQSQPVHKADVDQATDAAMSFLALLRGPKEAEEVYVSMNGSVWAQDAGTGLNSASVNVSVGFTQKSAG